MPYQPLYAGLTPDELTRERKALDDRCYYAARRPDRYKPDTIARAQERIAIIDYLLVAP